MQVVRRIQSISALGLPVKWTGISNFVQVCSCERHQHITVQDTFPTEKLSWPSVDSKIHIDEIFDVAVNIFQILAERVPMQLSQI